MATICFYAQFIKNKVGVNGLTVTWDVERVNRSTGARDALVTAGATNISVERRGLYGYRLDSADITTYDYVATAITAGDVDQQEIAAMWTLWSLSWHDILTAALTTVGSIGKLLVDTLDAAVSSRAAPGDEMSISATGLARMFTVDTYTTQPGVAGSVVHEILDGVNVVAFPAGAIDYTYTVTDNDTGLPVEGAEVWFATDAAFANIVWKGDTDAFGVARDVMGDLPRLDPGQYHIRVQRAGYAAMDDTEIVS